MSDTAITNSALDIFDEQAVPATRVRGYWQSVFYRLRHDPVTLAFAAIVLLIVLAAISAPLIAPFDPYKESIVGRLKPFGWRGHVLGTDELGRDMLSRLIYGGRVSLLMGVVPVAIASAIGGGLGIVAGFAGGRVNTAIMRMMDVFYAFPSVLLAVAIAGAMGGGIVNGMLALTLVFIPPVCRVAETATTQVRALDFIEAARASGAGSLPLRLHRGRPGRGCGEPDDPPPPRSGQRARPGFHLRLVAGQRQHPAGLRLVFSRSRRAPAGGRLGADAEHIAPVDLCRAG